MLIGVGTLLPSPRHCLYLFILSILFFRLLFSPVSLRLLNPLCGSIRRYACKFVLVFLCRLLATGRISFTFCLSFSCFHYFSLSFHFGCCVCSGNKRRCAINWLWLSCADPSLLTVLIFFIPFFRFRYFSFLIYFGY